LKGTLELWRRRRLKQRRLRALWRMTDACSRRSQRRYTSRKGVRRPSRPRRGPRARSLARRSVAACLRSEGTFPTLLPRVSPRLGNCGGPSRRLGRCDGLTNGPIGPSGRVEDGRSESRRQPSVGVAVGVGVGMGVGVTSGVGMGAGVAVAAGVGVGVTPGVAVGVGGAVGVCCFGMWAPPPTPPTGTAT